MNAPCLRMGPEADPPGPDGNGMRGRRRCGRISTTLYLPADRFEEDLREPVAVPDTLQASPEE